MERPGGKSGAVSDHRDDIFLKDVISFFYNNKWSPETTLKNGAIPKSQMSRTTKKCGVSTIITDENKMKTKFTLLTMGFSFLLIGMTFIISCKKEDPEEPASACGNGICDLGESNLTCPGDCPASNTINFTANVNGSAYSAIAYGTYLNSNYMVITASDDTTAAYDIIKIGLHSFTGVATYTLNEADYLSGTNSWAYYTTGLMGGFYIYCTNTVSPYIGTCTITKFDTSSKKVSGTFNYTGKYSYWQQASCGTCDSNMVYTVSGSFTDVGY